MESAHFTLYGDFLPCVERDICDYRCSECDEVGVSTGQSLCCFFENAATNSFKLMSIRSMLNCSRKCASLRVGSSGKTAQCFSDERFMIWRANMRSICVENRQPRNRKLLPLRICCTDSGIGV